MGQVDFDFLVVELAFAQHLAEFLPRGGILGLGRLCLEAESCLARRRQQRIQNAILGGILRAHLHLVHFPFANLLDGDFHEVADDGIHILADVTHLGELGGLDLDERRVGEPRKPAGDLCFAHARGADHENVFRRDFSAQRFFNARSPPAVAQRDGDGLLGFLLADDVLVEFVDDFLGGELGHGSEG